MCGPMAEGYQGCAVADHERKVRAPAGSESGYSGERWAGWRRNAFFSAEKQKFQEEMRCRQERAGTPGTAVTS